MAKLKNSIRGVPTGEIYPREIPAGEECPENLLPYAREIGALEEDGAAIVQPEPKPQSPADAKAGEGGDKKADDKKADTAKKDDKAS